MLKKISDFLGGTLMTVIGGLFLVASLVLSFWSVSCIRKGEPNED